MNATTVWLSATPFIAAALALRGVWLATRLKERSERRAEWWRRRAWAVERTADEDAYTSRIGAATVEALLTSDPATATATERDVIEAITLADLSHGEDTEGEPEHE
ncbi:hypothetical protein [Tsukamurella sp. NPDC003166]|uniref:hypothetical protein n=1 Tax=Tsukamurella sp. NPDC003166 TaxID=3154444 RepID=UPI0033A5FAA1